MAKRDLFCPAEQNPENHVYFYKFMKGNGYGSKLIIKVYAKGF